MTATQKKTQNSPPVDRIRVGSINVSIWANDTENGKRYSATYEQRYKDGKGKWQSSHSFNGSASLFLAKAANLAYDRMEELRQADKADGTHADDDGAYIDDEGDR